MADEATSLRAKAAWYRYLAEVGYDHLIIRELSRYAAELEAEAECRENVAVLCR